jgi:hypothetical protein
MAVQHITSELIVKVVMECCISNVMVGTNDDGCERIVMLGVSVRKMKAPTIKVETVTLIGRGI